jgi:hypothetical protein
MTPSPSPQVPLKFDVSKARADGVTDDQILEHLGNLKKFDYKKALSDGVSKQTIIDHLSGFETFAREEQKSSRKVTDTIIDVLRPILSGAGAAGATSLSGPFAPATAPAAYIGIDALLQKLQSDPQQSLASQVVGAEKGGVADSIINTGEQYLGGKLMERGLNVIQRGVKVFNNADIPDIYKFNPTTSQASRALLGEDSLITKATKGIEDLALGSKRKALDRSAGAGFTQALMLADDLDFNFSRNPQLMLDLIDQEWPKIAPRSNVRFKTTPGFEAPVTPISIKEVRAPGTPVRVVKNPADAEKGIESFIETRAAGPVKSYPTGTTEVTPGMETTVKYGQKVTAIPGKTVEPEVLSFSVLDNTISDPRKLNKVLADAQANGVGFNLKKSLQGYQFMKMFNEASERSVTAQGSRLLNNQTVRINPKKLDEMWLAPEMQDSYKTLYNAKQRSDITQFFKNIEMTQDKIDTGYRKLWIMGGGIGMASDLLLGHTIPMGGIGGVTGVYLGSKVLGKMLTNPKVARYFVALAGGEPLEASEKFAGRIIIQALQGSTVALINKDGSRTPVVVQGERLVPLR